MFNPYNMTYQPYFTIQAPSTIVPTFIYPQGLSFVIPQFILQNTYQNATSLDQNAIGHSEVAAQINQNSNKAQCKGPQVNSTQIFLNKSIIKEKIIKKPANRPATYLTERKYYLAQDLHEEQNSNRKLRPRISHKKNHKTTEKSIPVIQSASKKKETVVLLRDEYGSSQIFESSEKKKMENSFQQVSGNPTKTMEFPTSKEESK